MDFREAFYGNDEDSSFAILSFFQDNGFTQGLPPPIPACAIYANKVNGLRILGNTFTYTGDINNVPAPLSGVVYEEAGIKVEDHCSGNIATTTNNCANGVLTHNNFNNLTYGVRRAPATTLPNGRDVSVSFCRFENCRTGIYAAYTNGVRLIQNFISMRASPTLQTGIEIVESANFKLYNNSINTVQATAASLSQGIFVRDMQSNLANNIFTTAEKINFNSIANCSIAIRLLNNLITADNGIFILCNYMSNTVSSAQDIVSTPGTGPVNQYGIADQNGNKFSGGINSAGNTFSTIFPNTPNAQNFVYSGRVSTYYDDGASNPLGFAGINFDPSAPSHPCIPPNTGTPPYSRPAAYNQFGTEKPVLSKGQKPVVAPNPSHDGIYMLSGFGTVGYVVMDMFGRRLTSGNLTTEVSKLDLSFLSSGTYILTIQSEGQPPANYKLLRQ